MNSKHDLIIVVTYDLMKSTVKQNSQPKPMLSSDAPPLDFSFRNIKHLEQILTLKPHQGKRKPIASEIEESKPMSKDDKDSKSESGMKAEVKAEEEVIEKPMETKLEIIRTIEVSTLIAQQTQQNQVKSKYEPVQATKKVQSVELVLASLYLSYNKLRSIKNFYNVVDSVFPNIQNLKWIDLSHNQLVVLDYNFKQITGLKTLYLHCNFIKDFAEIEKLSHLEELRSITIHGNPLENHPQFRSLIIGLLSHVNKIDSALVTKREVETAGFAIKQISSKKLPVIQNAESPKTESSEDEQG